MTATPSTPDDELSEYSDFCDPEFFDEGEAIRDALLAVHRQLVDALDAGRDSAELRARIARLDGRARKFLARKREVRRRHLLNSLSFLLCEEGDYSVREKAEIDAVYAELDDLDAEDARDAQHAVPANTQP
jgi:hypothetical protein